MRKCHGFPRYLPIWKNKMTSQKRNAAFRGIPYQIYAGDPMDIPCVETSCLEKLCKHPVVSVNMITYNHESYIRQAIEGVMMQKTDFEFELIIGEDASTDKTREICFEYQKKYPDKIRVLWWHENLYRNPHPAGGNLRRATARCRGEFIAYCEGDDYWTDPFKLQRQVEIMRRHPDVSFCCHQFDVLQNGALSRWNEDRIAKLMSRSEDGIGFKFNAGDFYNPGIFTQTAAVLYRRSMFDKDFYLRAKFHCDIVTFYACLKGGLGYFINRTMSVYRIAESGVWQGMSDCMKAEFHLRFAWAMYDADPCQVTKLVYDSARVRLRNASFPWRLMVRTRRFVSRIVSRSLGRIRGQLHI